MRFNLPDGAEYDGTDEHGNDRFRVTIPLDEHGFFGRGCPSCGRTFLVSKESYDPLPDELRLWCVYCGHNDDHSEFMTSQQRARIMSLAEDVGRQMISRALDQSFGRLASRTRNNSFVRVEYKPSRVYPRPLPGVREEQLVRERKCEACGMSYAVFGEHRFCPVCGRLPAARTATDSLEAEASRLDALDALPPATHAVLREQGVLDRQYVDTIENVVGVIEALASTAFFERVPNAAELAKGKGNVFQRLDDLADLFRTHLSKDLAGNMGSRWVELQRAWAGRHVHAHNDGVVDTRYLRSVPTTTLKLGQRLSVTEGDARRTIDNARALADEITRP
jgi:uncharacterized Zn finger protein (UPF0148 family)